MTTFETMLIAALVSVVVGVSSFFLWIFKSLGPRIMGAFEKRNEALVTASQQTAEAVTKIPEAIKSFEIALLGAEKRLVEKIDDSHDKLLGKIDDSRISELYQTIQRHSQPGQCPPK